MILEGVRITPGKRYASAIFPGNALFIRGTLQKLIEKHCVYGIDMQPVFIRVYDVGCQNKSIKFFIAMIICHKANNNQ